MTPDPNTCEIWSKLTPEEHALLQTALLEKSGIMCPHPIKSPSCNGVALLSEWQGRDHPTGVEGLGF
jgi:hypothetical protein